MCDPEMIHFGNVSALYVCSNTYILGTVQPTANGYEMVPLPGMPHGGIKFEGGGSSAGKGFYDESAGRNLLWVSSHRQGFTLAREITVDHQLEILLSYPAQEYAHSLRSATPFVSLQGADVGAATAAVAAAAPSLPQLDVDATFMWDSITRTPINTPLGITVLNGALFCVVCFQGNRNGTLGCGQPSGLSSMPEAAAVPTSCSLDGHGSMPFTLKPGETSINLRVVVDGTTVEAFAAHGRAQYVSSAQRGGPSSSVLGLVAGAGSGAVLSINVSGWTLAFGHAGGNDDGGGGVSGASGAMSQHPIL